MGNVRVTCELLTPIAGDAPYLDSLIELRMARKAKTIMESKNGHRHTYGISERGQPIDISG